VFIINERKTCIHSIVAAKILGQYYRWFVMCIEYSLIDYVMDPNLLISICLVACALLSTAERFSWTSSTIFLCTQGLRCKHWLLANLFFNCLVITLCYRGYLDFRRTYTRCLAILFVTIPMKILLSILYFLVCYSAPPDHEPTGMWPQATAFIWHDVQLLLLNYMLVNNFMINIWFACSVI
jgi:hypothetical protein